MRDAREWACDLTRHARDGGRITVAEVVRAIQSEAARSERERAARVCEEADMPFAGWFAYAIRALPRVPSGPDTDVGDGKPA